MRGPLPWLIAATSLLTACASAPPSERPMTPTSPDASAEAQPAPDEPTDQQRRKALLDRLVALDQRGRQARQAGDLPGAIAAWRELLTVERLPATDAIYANTAYAIACAHALLGQRDDALRALEQAARDGYTNADHARTDADLAALRDAPRFQAALTEMEANTTRLRVYDVTTWDNPTAGHAALHAFDRVDSPQARELRDTYQLDALVADAPTRFEAQKRALAWVHERWSHHGLTEPSASDALTILAEASAGARFRCVEYSVVLAQVLTALGMPARVVRLRAAPMSYGLGRGHVVTEGWNDDLQRWIILDGQNNAWWSRDGVPLSGAELQAALAADPAAPGVQIHHEGSTWARTPPRDAWLAYFVYLSIATDNRVFDRDPSGSPPPGSRWMLLPPDHRPELLFQGAPIAEDITTDAALLYPALNRAHVRLETPDRGSPDHQVRVHLTSVTPSFDHFRVNGADLDPDEAAWTWTLTPGENTLTAQAVNAAGRAGAAARVVLNYHPRR